MKSKFSSLFSGKKSEPKVVTIMASSNRKSGMDSEQNKLTKLNDAAKERQSLDNWKKEFPQWLSKKFSISEYVDKVQQAAQVMNFELLKKLFINMLLLVQPSDLRLYNVPGPVGQVRTLPINRTEQIIHAIARPSIEPDVLGTFLEKSKVAQIPKVEEVITQTVSRQHEVYQAGALLVLGDQGWRPISLKINSISRPDTPSYVRPQLSTLVTSMIQNYLNPRQATVKKEPPISSLKNQGEIKMVESFLNTSKCLLHRKSKNCNNTLGTISKLVNATPTKKLEAANASSVLSLKDRQKRKTYRDMSRRDK